MMVLPAPQQIVMNLMTTCHHSGLGGIYVPVCTPVKTPPSSGAVSAAAIGGGHQPLGSLDRPPGSGVEQPLHVLGFYLGGSAGSPEPGEPATRKDHEQPITDDDAGDDGTLSGKK